ncbi:hypothetical protein [Crocinitomix catalasitica]|uniref:hypothetical protein n=1 Tax=Crocinitomix catalasitica TaxID=184607 RepID=UPI000485732B|nr:hypothetical protein [Crocinitomix catalasitica]
MNRINRILINILCCFQFIWSSILIFFSVKGLVTIDCDNPQQYSAHAEILISDNCYLNYFLVYNISFIVPFVGLIASILLFYKQKIGWIGSVFVNAMFAVILVFLLTITQFTLRYTELLIMLILIIGVLGLVLMCKRSIREYFKVKIWHIVLIGVVIGLLILINYMIFSIEPEVGGCG